MDVIMGCRKPQFADKPNNKLTTMVNYIQRQYGDINTSLYINPLYDLTNSTHKYPHNNYDHYDLGKKY